MKNDSSRDTLDNEIYSEPTLQQTSPVFYLILFNSSYNNLLHWQ